MWHILLFALSVAALYYVRAELIDMLGHVAEHGYRKDHRLARLTERVNRLERDRTIHETCNMCETMVQLTFVYGYWNWWCEICTTLSRMMS